MEESKEEVIHKQASQSKIGCFGKGATPQFLDKFNQQSDGEIFVQQDPSLKTKYSISSCFGSNTGFSAPVPLTILGGIDEDIIAGTINVNIINSQEGLPKFNLATSSTINCEGNSLTNIQNLTALGDGSFNGTIAVGSLSHNRPVFTSPSSAVLTTGQPASYGQFNGNQVVPSGEYNGYVGFEVGNGLSSGDIPFDLVYSTSSGNVAIDNDAGTFTISAAGTYLAQFSCPYATEDFAGEPNNGTYVQVSILQNGTAVSTNIGPLGTYTFNEPTTGTLSCNAIIAASPGDVITFQFFNNAGQISYYGTSSGSILLIQ